MTTTATVSRTPRTRSTSVPFGNRVKAFRKANDVSRAQLAEAAKVSHLTIYNVEQAPKYGKPSEKTIEALDSAMKSLAAKPRAAKPAARRRSPAKRPARGSASSK